MTQLITRDGFVAESWPEGGVLLDFEAFWQGQDLPIEERVGVVFEATSDPANLIPWFSKVKMVVIPFASSADGRGFSQARQLRQLGYPGTIRARGHVLVDQFRAALRVGIDEIEIPDEQAARMPEDQWTAVALREGYRSMLLAAE